MYHGALSKPSWISRKKMWLHQSWWEDGEKKLQRGQQEHWRNYRNFWQVLVLHVTISRILHMSEQWGWVGRLETRCYEKEHPKPSELYQKMHSVTPNHVGKCDGLTRQRLNFLVLSLKDVPILLCSLTESWRCRGISHSNMTMTHGVTFYMHSTLRFPFVKNYRVHLTLK